MADGFHSKIVGCSVGLMGSSKFSGTSQRNYSQHLQQLQRAIAEEFELGPASVTQEARQLFRPGKESILAGNEAMQMAWLVRIQRARIRFQERLEERQAGYRAERQMMAGWLRRASG